MYDFENMPYISLGKKNVISEYFYFLKEVLYRIYYSFV